MNSVSRVMLALFLAGMLACSLQGCGGKDAETKKDDGTKQEGDTPADNKNEEKTPTDDKKGDDKNPAETKGDDAKPPETKGDDGKPAEGDDKNPAETKGDDAKPPKTKGDDGKPAEGDDKNSAETKGDDAKPPKTKGDDGKPAEDSGAPSVTVECDELFDLEKGCSVTFTCSDPPTVKASSECPDVTLTWMEDPMPCQTYVDDEEEAARVAAFQCADLVLNTDEVVTDAVSNNMGGSTSGTLEEKDSSAPSVTVECDEHFYLEKGCSVTFTCSDPPTVKASSECPDVTLTWTENSMPCQTYVNDREAAEWAALFQCANLFPSAAVLTDAVRTNVGWSTSGALEQKAFYMLLGGFIVAALYLAVRGVLVCSGVREARDVKTAMNQIEMPHLSAAV